MIRKNKSIYIVLLMVVLIGVTIGYAVINSTLNINGKSNISKNSWDIHFDNIVVKDESVEAVKIPTIERFTTVNFEVNLNLPGDFYEFTVDVVNDGSIDAMIDSVEKTPDLTTAQQKYLNYIIEYQNGEQITTKQLVKSKEFVRLKVRVEYKSDITAVDLPTTSETLNLGFNVNYVQSDGTGNLVKNMGTDSSIIAHGDINNVGTLVEIGTEKFYTIGTDGDNVKLFSMYNLYVGGEYNYSTGEWTAYGEEATGMQNEKMLGYYFELSIMSGTTAFSSSEAKYEGSIVEDYVNNYKELLEYNFEVDIVDARLATVEEFINDELGCINNNDQILCDAVCDFVKNTTFWTGSISSDVIRPYYYDSSNRVFAANIEYYDKDNAGVRPVILVSKDDIIINNKPYVNGSLDDIGTIVSIGDQYFYTIGSDEDDVKLLSMYNLYVGNEVSYIDFDNGDEIIMNPIQNPTGMQKSKALGFSTNYFPYYGTTAFSNVSSNYSGSLAEEYVNNYKNLLEIRNDLTIKEARLVTLEEVELLCIDGNRLCASVPEFIYSTSYWLDVSNENSVYFILFGGTILSMEYNMDFFAGIRPIIVISKNYFE